MFDILFHCNFILSTAEKTTCCEKIEFAAGCSNPSGWYSSIKFGRIICLPKGVVHEKFHSNLVNTSWIKAICNKFLSKCSILQQPPCFQHVSPLLAWKELTSLAIFMHQIRYYKSLPCYSQIPKLLQVAARRKFAVSTGNSVGCY